MRFAFLFIVGLSLIPYSSSCLAGYPAATTNIVLIFVDDLGYADIGPIHQLLCHTGLLNVASMPDDRVL